MDTNFTLESLNKNLKNSETRLSDYLKYDERGKELFDEKNIRLLNAKDAFISYEADDYIRNTKIKDLKKVIQIQREKNSMELNLYKDKIESQFDEISRLEEQLDSLKKAEEDLYYV